MQIGINEIKKGLTIELEGEVYTVVEFAHVKPGKGGAFRRTKLKNLKSRCIINKTFRPNDKLEEAYIEKKNIRFLYSSKDIYEFMDHETFEQISLHRDQLGQAANYFKENLEVTALIYKNEIITLELPIFIDLKIISTEPGFRGNTSKSGRKSAKTESETAIQVPLFVNEGDVVRIDTRTGEYVGRVT